MAIVGYNDLSTIRQKHSSKTIVLCTGAFDLTHAGHVLFFENCKKQGDILVVAVGTDAIVKKNKSIHRPILNEHIRMKIISSLRSVDYCLLDQPTPGYIFIDETILERLRPDKLIVNSDALYITQRAETTNKLGIKLIILERHCPPEFDNISTTKIIEKIKSL